MVCEDADVNISGVNNTVTLTGHCLSVSVSGVENKITVDSADVIGASGFDNEIIYLSGDPKINASGSNSVSRDESRTGRRDCPDHFELPTSSRSFVGEVGRAVVVERLCRE